MYLQDIAKVIRSKNAGPRCTTLDIMFNNDTDYQRVVESGAINAVLIARLYDTPQADVKIIEYPMSRALKIAIRSEERRVGKECVVRVDLGGRRIIKKKKK